MPSGGSRLAGGRGLNGERLPVAVVGASGFLGAEAVRLLVGHPKVEPAYLAAGRSAGKHLGAVRPSFPSDPNLMLRETDAAAIASCAAWAILALPHGESAPLATELLRQGVGVIDLGSDFRLRDPADHRTYYDREAPEQGLLDRAFYSLPEITGPPPEGCRLIASPGCFATALALLLWPWVGRVERVSVFGATGSSGSGIDPKPGVHHATRHTNFVGYKPLNHQHMGELRQLLGPGLEVDFLPHSAPMTRGILVSAAMPEDAVGLYDSAYAGKPFIKLLASPPNTGATLGTNRADVGVVGRACYVAIDNLIKGGAGQAIQSLNLLMGWDESLGLSRVGLWP